MNRLATISDELATSFAASERKIEALHLACARAIDENDLRGENISEALKIIREGRDDPALSKRMFELSQSYDEKYFELTDNEMIVPVPADALDYFQKARAISALAFGLDDQHN